MPAKNFLSDYNRTMSHSRVFGSTATGIEIMLYKLSRDLPIDNGDGKKFRFEAEILPYGATIQQLIVPDKNGKGRDVILGCSNVRSYEKSQCYMGCIVGRVANRIRNGHLAIDDQTYQLNVNNGPNHLHGGLKGFNTKIWRVSSSSSDHVTMDYVSQNGEENYPGTLTARVTYSLDVLENNLCIFTVDLSAVTTARTPCNLTSHIYFNLTGLGKDGNLSTNIDDHDCQFDSTSYMVSDQDHMPSGKLSKVTNTPYDFTTTRNLGEAIETMLTTQDYAYDNYFKLKNVKHDFSRLPAHQRPAASVSSRTSGVRMRIFTNQPGFQFYTGDYVKNHASKKPDQFYGARSGFCIETHGYPEALNNKKLPSIILDPGAVCHQRTVYVFDTI